VISRAVEPAVLAVAELLDNAARHSQPDTPIEVSIQSAHHGITIVIDDCGIGMLEDEMRRATELLSGQRSVDVTRLGDPPAFGHAVVGRLAARYGFRAHADSASPFGGLRATVFLPGNLLTPVDASVPPIRSVSPVEQRPRPAATESPVTHQTVPVSHPSVPGLSDDGLPQRRRRKPTAEHPRAATTGQSRSTAVRSAEETAATLGAFQRGTEAGRSAPSPRTDGPPAHGETDDTERQVQP
jgi:hypothetical protein